MSVIIKSVLMLILLAVGLGIFAWQMWTKTKLLLASAKEDRFDHLRERMYAMVRFGLGQSRQFKEFWPGLMHALLFWGFLVLLLAEISTMGAAFSAEGDWSIFWFLPGLDHAYIFVKGFTELLVLLMVLYALFRRLVTKPERITLSFEANLILIFIATLMITDYLYDAANFNLGIGLEAQPYAIISAMVAKWIHGMSHTGLIVLKETVYWIHAIVLLTFLNLLPVGKHFHVITALPNVFFTKLEPMGAIKEIKDLEEQEAFGVSKITEFTWKQNLDLYTCTECGRCTVNCPATITGKPLNPKLLIDNLRDHLYENSKAIIDGKYEPGMTENELPDLFGVITEDVLWACTTCGSCDENCPVTIEHVDKIVDMRRYLVLMEGRVSDEMNTTMKNLENKSNPWGMPMGDREKWISDFELEVPKLSDKGDAEYLLFVGCAGAYDDRSKKITKALVQVLQHAKVDFAILGKEEGCCGDVARRSGNEYLYQMQAQQNIDTFNEYGVKKVITLCPHGYNTIKNEYPQFGGNYEVIHHTELINQLIADGKIEMKQELNAPQHKVAFHDSCYLARYNRVIDEPRNVLTRISGLELVEPERAGINTFCCGAGGGRMFMEEKIGERINQTRVKQLTEEPVDTIATSCPFCMMMIRDGVNELNMTDDVKVVDLAELVVQNMKTD